jgi:hypothetical protein
MEPPPEAGFPEEGTTHYVMQVHYNNASGKNAGEVDKSGFDICTTTQLRKNDAGVMAFGSVSFNLPPHATTDLACDYTPLLLDKVHIFSSRPHMHGLGKALTTYVNHNSQQQKVVDQQAFDFNSQVGFQTSADLEAGDTVTTHCIYNNTTDKTVTWGEATGDEMCFNFVAYYPIVQSPVWGWVTPSVMASCRTQ